MQGGCWFGPMKGWAKVVISTTMSTCSRQNEWMYSMHVIVSGWSIYSVQDVDWQRYAVCRSPQMYVLETHATAPRLSVLSPQILQPKWRWVDNYYWKTEEEWIQEFGSRKREQKNPWLKWKCSGIHRLFQESTWYMIKEEENLRRLYKNGNESAKPMG